LRGFTAGLKPRPSGSIFYEMAPTLVRGVDGLVHGDEHDDKHSDDINAQAPEQSFGAERKMLAAEMGAAFGGDDLVRFEQGEHGARILQVELLGLDVNWQVNRLVNRSERALIFSYVCVL
jgi:hypothetical protein